MLSLLLRAWLATISIIKVKKQIIGTAIVVMDVGLIYIHILM